MIMGWPRRWIACWNCTMERCRTLPGRSCFFVRHSSESWNPASGRSKSWIPAFAGMTKRGVVPRIPINDLFRPAAAIALLIGATAVQMLPALPPLWTDVALLACALAIALFVRRARWIGFVLLGAAWTMLRADVALSHRLAPALEGEDIVVSGS